MAPGRRSKKWSEWTDWCWDPKHRRYWRARQDDEGNWVYEYFYPDTAGEAAPRDSVESLAGTFSCVNVGDQDPSYTQQESSSIHASSAAEDSSSIPDGSDTAHSHGQAGAQDKGKGRAAGPSVASRSRSHEGAAKNKVSSSKKHRHRAEKDPAEYRESEDEPPVQGQYVPLDIVSGRPAGPSRAGPADRSMSQQGSSYSAASADPDGDRSNENLEELLDQADPYMTGTAGAAYPGWEPLIRPQPGFPHDRGNGYGSDWQTPKPSFQPTVAVFDDYRDLDASPTRRRGRELDMHNGYVVEHSSRFRPGEVFKILWYEPLGVGASKTGSTTEDRSEIITNGRTLQNRGKRYYEGFRRFIVVANDEGNCTCVPILTYEHKACTKKGVKPHKHGIVHQVNRRPEMVRGEPELGFPPIRVNLYEKAERLDKESRVNYAKLTNVEHNLPVYFIGSVVPEDFAEIVMPAVDECWAAKTRW